MSGDELTGDEPWLQAAARALALAVDEDLDCAVEHVDELAGYGMNAVALGMCAWADTMLTFHPNGGRRADDAVHLITTDEDGHRTDVEAMPTRSRWAAQLIAARAASDEQGWRDLLLSTGPDPMEWRRRVITLLLTCALNVRDAKRRGLQPVHEWPIAGSGG